jgi:hypothetical protein
MYSDMALQQHGGKTLSMAGLGEYCNCIDCSLPC